MTLLAALCTGVAAYFAVGWLSGHLPRLDRLTPTRREPSWADNQRVWLAQAGLALSPRQFWVASAAGGVAVFVVVTALTATPAVAVVPAASAVALPRAYFSRERARRLREVQEAWPDGLRELVAAINAGMSVAQALVALAESGPAPLRRALERFPVLLRLLGPVAALELVKAELADPTSDRVVEILILAHERGGRIVTELLRDLADATAADVRTVEEITTGALEQKINARAVFVMPWLVLLVLTARPGHFRDFYQSPGGVLVIAVAGLMSAAGLWLLGRLARDPIERRLLAGRTGTSP